MPRIETKNEIKQIVKKYAQELKKNNFSFESIYLFGSYIKGKPTRWSDIDVAVVSDRFKNDWDKNEDLLWHLRRKVDTKIEPHGFSIKDFQDISDPMVYEIKKTGIKVA